MVLCQENVIRECYFTHALKAILELLLAQHAWSVRLTGILISPANLLVVESPIQKLLCKALLDKHAAISMVHFNSSQAVHLMQIKVQSSCLFSLRLVSNLYSNLNAIRFFLHACTLCFHSFLFFLYTPQLKGWFVFHVGHCTLNHCTKFARNAGFIPRSKLAKILFIRVKGNFPCSSNLFSSLKTFKFFSQ